MGLSEIKRVRVEPNGVAVLGVSVLTALSVAGIHSAVNPSVFTLRTFSNNPEARENAEIGLWMGLGMSLLAAGAIWVVFKDPVPAAVAALTGGALFGIGMWAIQPRPGAKANGFETPETTKSADGISRVVRFSGCDLGWLPWN